MKIFKHSIVLFLVFSISFLFTSCEDEEDDNPAPTTQPNSNGGGGNGNGTGGSGSNKTLNSFLALSGEYQFNDSLATTGNISTRTNNLVYDVFEFQMGSSSTDYVVLFRMIPDMDKTLDVNDLPELGTYSIAQDNLALTIFPSNNPGDIYTARKAQVTITQSNDDIIAGTITSDSLISLGGTKRLQADINFRTTWKSVFY